MEIRIIGTLAEDARFSITHTAPHQGHLAVQITAAKGLPIVATQNVGSNPSDHIAASAKAHELRRGSRVTVYAAGATTQTDHGLACIRLHGVTEIIPETHQHTEVDHAIA